MGAGAWRRRIVNGGSRCCGGPVYANPVEQRLFDRRRACERNPRKKLHIQTGGDENHPGKYGDSKTAAQPFADAKSSLEKRQHSSASRKRQGKGCRRAEGVGQEQKRGPSARAVERGTGQDEAEDRTGARCPQQPRGDAEERGGEGSR